MPRRNGPTFEQWASEYDRLVAIARQRGLRVHHYSHRRVPNHVARDRVEVLARRLNETVLLNAALPSIDPVNDPLRALRTGRVETVQVNPPPPQITPTVPASTIAAPVWGGRRGRRHPSPEHAAFA